MISDNQNIFRQAVKHYIIQSIYTNKLVYLSLSQISHLFWVEKMLGLKLEGIDRHILMTIDITAKVEDPQSKATLFLTDRILLRLNGSGRGRNTQMVHNIIQDDQIATQSEEIKKLLTIIYKHRDSTNDWRDD